MESKPSVWSRLQASLNVLSECAGWVPSLKSAIGPMLSFVEMEMEATEHKQESEDLASRLAALSGILARHLEIMKPHATTLFLENMKRIASSIEEQTVLVTQAVNRSQGRRLIENSQDEFKLLCYYRQIEGLFHELQDYLLKEMSPARSAAYNLGGTNRRFCTKDTRTMILSQLDIWSLNAKAPNIFWMSGMAGTGKTTIAYTFAEELARRKRLGGSFFCTRTNTECQDVGRIIPTIACQLARYSDHFQAALCQVLKDNPNIGLESITSQFEQLLKGPLLKAKDYVPHGSVIIIDALDECTHDSEVVENVEMVLDLLFQFASELPVKFFVTSRPEPVIRKKVTYRPDKLHEVAVLHEIELSLVQADIELYLREELLPFVPATQDQVKQLVQLSGKLFIYAATAVRYIRTTLGDPIDRLNAVLATSSGSTIMHKKIDLLYKEILKEALHNPELEDSEKKRISIVLQAAVCAREPINLETLGSLSGVNNSNQALTALQLLLSVLYVSEDSKPTVTTLHASFAEYMFDRERSAEFFCDKTKHDALLSERCFEIMSKRLRFNICRLESSFTSDKDIKGLSDRFEEIPQWQTLSYSCRYWGDHLREAEALPKTFLAIDRFLSEHLLFWIEVMNLNRWANLGIQELSHAKHWLTTNSAPAELVKLAEDSRIFLTTFVANPSSQSTPHIYLSALPFCPQSSSVSENYSKYTRGVVKVGGQAVQHRQATPFATWRMKSEVQSIALSSDGSYLAFGCTDGTLGVKNSYNGADTMGPCNGHTDWVTTVAFSSKDHCIASGSDDGTICVWSTRDGSLVMGPLKGHTEGVTSVAFSPNNTCIASGSKDYTIRVWSLSTRHTNEHRVLKGHTGWVWSIAFSSDGTSIVSGSRDRTIRIWDAESGAPLSSPFTGHSDGIRSVAYAPKRECIVSGASDNTLRVWNERGTRMIDPLKGHSGEVSSLAFSNNGVHIVSGANDCTICIWNIKTGTILAGPIASHTGPVNSVAFSPDSTRIFSGSDDRTIRVWDAPEATPESTRFRGHTREVNSVSFSSDGVNILSSSDDCSICVWDSINGSLVAGPLKGHTELVMSARFSHDDSRVVSGSRDKTVRIWNLLTQAPIFDPLEGHTDEVSCVAFSPNGGCVASGSFDNTIRVWDVQEGGKPTFNPITGHTAIIWSVAFSPDGLRIASGSHDCTIRIWSAQDGTPVTSHFGHGNGLMMSVSFSPNGAHIVAGSDNHSICIWNAETGELVTGPFHGHADVVTSVVFSPCGKKLVSGSADGIIRICDAETGDLLAPPLLGHTSGIWSVAISPDSKRIVSGSDDHTIRVWDLNSASSALFYALLKDGISITEEGWVTAQGSKIFCVPPGITSCVPSPHNTLVIGELGPVKIDYQDLLFGDSWHQCYTQTRK